MTTEDTLALAVVRALRHGPVPCPHGLPTGWVYVRECVEGPCVPLCDACVMDAVRREWEWAEAEVHNFTADECARRLRQIAEQGRPSSAVFGGEEVEKTAQAILALREVTPARVLAALAGMNDSQRKAFMDHLTDVYCRYCGGQHRPWRCECREG